jgi:hypothetical protein
MKKGLSSFVISGGDQAQDLRKVETTTTLIDCLAVETVLVLELLGLETAAGGLLVALLFAKDELEVKTGGPVLACAVSGCKISTRSES